jgi:hypothetical protein
MSMDWEVDIDPEAVADLLKVSVVVKDFDLVSVPLLKDSLMDAEKVATKDAVAEGSKEAVGDPLYETVSVSVSESVRERDTVWVSDSLPLLETEEDSDTRSESDGVMRRVRVGGIDSEAV